MRRVVVGVALMGVVLGAVTWPGYPFIPFPGPDGFVINQDEVALTAFWTLFWAGVLGLARPWALRVAAGVVALIGLGFLVAVGRAALGTGLPDDAAVILVASGSVEGLAVVAGVVPARRRPLVWWRPVLASVVAVVLVVGTGVVLDRVTSDVLESSTTAAPGGPPPPVAGRADTPRWTWRHPVGAHTVLAAGQGVVVALRDGSVVALDGRTGTPRWWFRRSEVSAEIQASPDRGTVVVVHSPRPGRGSAASQRLTVLDADTGFTRWAGPVSTSLSQIMRVLTDRVVATATKDEVVARSLDDGRVVWRVGSPPGCYLPPPEQLSSVAVVPVYRSCTRTVDGLDESTGRRRWQVREPPALPGSAGSGSYRPFALYASPDGRDLVWDEGLVAPAVRVVLDPLSGAVRARLDDRAVAIGPGRPVATGVRRGSLTTPLRPEAAVGPAGPVPLPGGCGPLPEIAVAATETVTVRLCQAAEALLQVDGRAPVAIGLTGRPVARDPLGHGDDDAGAVTVPVGFTVPAPGASVVGLPEPSGTTLVGLD